MEVYLADSYLKAHHKLAKKNKQLPQKVKKQLQKFHRQAKPMAPGQASQPSMYE